jgi:phage-related protein
MILSMPGVKKPCEFIGSAKEDLSAMPDEVKEVMGYAIFQAQSGEKHQSAKPLKSFGGAGVLEGVDHFDGNTYRAVYTVRFAGVVYVLHAFQKKSKRGNETPRREIELVRQRLKEAERHHEENYEKRRARPA